MHRDARPKRVSRIFGSLSYAGSRNTASEQQAVALCGTQTARAAAESRARQLEAEGKASEAPVLRRALGAIPQGK
ncbi:hypothetical protein SBA4_4710009 [Candidatus Sulfopaludibacter sp. SbA4]|nr:hypothetical protein SBA4_4710009 [Candidatus Sulfopaludibacter sp. SbA4]